MMSGGPDKEDEGASVAVVGEEKPKEVTEIDKLKKALIDSFYGTDRGLTATTKRAPRLLSLLHSLKLKIRLRHQLRRYLFLTANGFLRTHICWFVPLIVKAFIAISEWKRYHRQLTQESFAVQNSIRFSEPLATTSISTNAKCEVRSPKRVQIKFEEGIIGTPQITDSIVLPDNAEFLGQKIDLSPLKGLFTSVQATASSVAWTISSQPRLKFPIANSNAQSWLLTTCLDEELRISRGDAGSVFVLIKEGSSLLTP